MSNRNFLDRRTLLGGAVGVAATLGVASCVPGEPSTEQTRGPQVDVRDAGAVGDGVHDDTEAFARALSRAGDGRGLYVPAGTYLVDRLPQLTDRMSITGDGPDRSVIVSDSTGPVLDLSGLHRVVVRQLGLFVTGADSTAVKMAASFACLLEGVVIRGNHQGENYPEYAGQVGVDLSENSGGSTFVGCDFTNLGVGLRTSCIQNYVTACRFTTNRYGVVGTGNDHNAGLSIVGSEFSSDTHPQTTDAHVLVEGAANVWWLANVWFEGCNAALRIGDANGGPAQLGIVNAKLAAREVDLDLRSCRQPYLANIALDPDADSSPTLLAIDPDGCPDGTASGLISSTGDDIGPEAFPAGWVVTGRGTRFGGSFVAPLTVRAREEQPLVSLQDIDGKPVGGVLSDGTFVSDDAAAGLVLRGPNGNYYRLTIGADGQPTTTDIGPNRPS